MISSNVYVFPETTIDKVQISEPMCALHENYGAERQESAKKYAAFWLECAERAVAKGARVSLADPEEDIVEEVMKGGVKPAALVVRENQFLDLERPF